MGDEINLFRELEPMSGDASSRLLVGFNDHFVVDLQTGFAGTDGEYVDVSTSLPNGRGVIAFATAGIVKVEYTRGSDGATKTMVLYLNKGAFFQLRRVSKVYVNYKTGTQATVQTYNDSGTAIRGLLVLR